MPDLTQPEYRTEQLGEWSIRWVPKQDGAPPSSAPTLTAIQLSNGRLETTSGSEADLTALAEQTLAPYREAAPEAQEPVVATVRRPTPSCPACMPGAIEPATEALLAFLTPAQHASWAAHRVIELQGGLSGYRYLLAHRHSPVARQLGRICYDLDFETVVHFHDWAVPPEEEVLAALLILQTREHWLRNEATLFHSDAPRYKNPFGDGLDGTETAAYLSRIGNAVGLGISSHGELAPLKRGPLAAQEIYQAIPASQRVEPEVIG